MTFFKNISTNTKPSTRWTIITKFALVITTLVGLGFGYLFSKQSLNLQRLKRPYIYNNKYLLPSPATLQATSLNYRTFAADVLWVTAVQYISESLVERRRPVDSTEYASAVAYLDPYFYKIYSWHSSTRIALAGEPQLDDIQAANEILLLGMEYFPNDWQLPYEYAANFMGFGYAYDLDLKTREQQLKSGMEQATRGASLPGAPDIMPLMALSFQRKYARVRAGEREYEDADFKLSEADKELLTRLYLSTNSKATRLLILKRLQSHDADISEQITEQVETYNQQFQSTLNSSSVAYLPTDLFATLLNPLGEISPFPIIKSPDTDEQ